MSKSTTPNLIEIDPGIRSSPIATDALTYADNPRPRCPVALLLDCSGSMQGPSIAELNQALRQFCDELGADIVATASVELAVITFGGSVRLMRQFSALSGIHPLPELSADGNTPMGEALRLALAEVSERRAFYRCHGLPAYQPWLVLMTDGQPNDEWHQAATAALALVKERRLVMLGVAIGPHADMATLRQIVGNDPGPYRLDGLKFRNFFRWLSDSLRSVTQGPACAQSTVILPPGANDWTL